MRPGDLVYGLFPGAQGMKERPCVVISTDYYQAERPDLLLAVVTSQMQQKVSPLDYALQDWAEAGLSNPSLVRMYFGTRAQRSVSPLGRLSERDWKQVQRRLQLSVEFQARQNG